MDYHFQLLTEVQEPTGCFTDAATRDLNGHQEQSDDMTNEKCYTICETEASINIFHTDILHGCENCNTTSENQKTHRTNSVKYCIEIYL